MNSRGISHIEVILSFVIFVTFLIFAFYYFSPFKADDGLSTFGEYVSNKILQESSIVVEKYSIFIKSDSILVSLDSPSELNNPGMLARNSLGQKVDSGISGEIITFSNPPNRFVIAYFSTYLDRNQLIGGDFLTPENYSISSSETLEIISEGKLVELNSTYYGDYETLKSRLNIPHTRDFGFRIEFDNGETILADREHSQNIEVFSKERRVEILRNTNKVEEFATLTVMVW